MDKKKCKNCSHYRRHYIVDRQRCEPVNCGHCTYPRLKKRRPEDVACQYFELLEGDRDLPDREGVISFLTTDFLQEILKLTLPYEVGGGEELEG